MQLEEIKVCPVCRQDKFHFLLSCKDYLVSKQNFTIYQCNNCGFKLTNPRPSESTIGQFYKSDQYISHNDDSKGLINTLYRIVRNYALKGKLNLINRLNNGQGYLLDIGCGTGTFLEIAQKNGWKIAGVELDDTARAVARKRLGIDIASEITQSSITKFDIITLWHVLEHISNLDDTLQQIAQRLSQNGVLLLALPNSSSWDANFYKEFWAAYDVPRHLHHFVPETISQLLLRHGFVLCESRPMYFDSFYISMLSAGYRDGKPKLTEGLINGIRSNWTASRTGQYSSLVYLFKKQ